MQRHEVRGQSSLGSYLLYQCGCDVGVGSAGSDTEREGSSYKNTSTSCCKDFGFVHFLGVGRFYFIVTNGHYNYRIN